MPESMPIGEARKSLGDLARRAASSGETIELTDRGRPIAAVVSTTRLLELQEQVALERYYRRKAEGTLVTVPHEEVVRQFEAGEL